VPKRAEAQDGEALGDTWVELRPEDPDYAEVLASLLERIKNSGAE
jgi:hypothetical protein